MSQKQAVEYCSSRSILGPAIAVTLDIAKFLEDVEAKCGPIASFGFMGTRNLITTDPDLSQHIMNSKNYRKTNNNIQFARAIGDGLLTSHGKKWTESRRVVQPLFSQHYLDTTFVSNAVEIITQVQQDWIRKTEDGPITIDLREEMAEISFRVGLRVTFGMQDEDIDKKIIQEMNRDLQRMKGYISRVPPRQWLELRRIFLTPSYLRFRKARSNYKKLIRRLIDHHIATMNNKSESYLIDHLLEAVAVNPNFPATTFEAELTTLTFASSVSTAVALQWMFVLMDENPSAVTAIRNAVDEIVRPELMGNQLDKTSVYASLCKHEVLQATIKEALRLYPPFWFQARKAIDDEVFDGVEIKSGTCVLINVAKMHRSPSLWKNPNAYDYTRFLDSHKDEIAEGAYLPFGSGMRKCPASQLASMEMMLVAAIMLSEFDIVIQNPITRRTTRIPDLVMETEYPLRAVISRRRK